MIHILIAFFSVAAFAQDQIVIKGGGRDESECGQNGVECEYEYVTDACTTAANMMTSEMLGGVSPGTPAFSFGVNGKTEILDQNKIVRRNDKDGTETITYKAQRPKLMPGFFMSQPLEFETVERTMIIKRDSSGRMTSLTKLNPYELPKLPKPSKNAQQMGWPTPGDSYSVKSLTNDFAYDGENCSISQSVGVEKKDKAFAREEKKIYFDKKLCDQIMPGLMDMGHEEIEKCSSLMGNVEALYDKRSAEVAKEGKSFSNPNLFGPEKKGASTFNVIGVINGCMMSRNQMIYGMGVGGMIGMPSMGMPLGVPPTKDTKGGR